MPMMKYPTYACRWIANKSHELSNDITRMIIMEEDYFNISGAVIDLNVSIGY